MTRAIETVVLAAGRGSRFGGGKLLAPLGTGCVLDASLRAAFGSPGRVHLVLPPDDQEVREAALRWVAAAGRSADLVCVIAHDSHKGLSASLKAGIRSAKSAVGVVVFLGDMPAVPLDAGARVKAALTQGAPAAAVSVQGRRGHPVGLSSRLFPDLLRLEGDQGGASVLVGLKDDLVLLDLQDPGIFLDIDTAEDLTRARKALK